MRLSGRSSTRRLGLAPVVALVVALVVAVIVGLVATGCQKDADEVREDPSDATATLQQQRLDVRALTREVRDRAVDQLDGRRIEENGYYDGCRSAFPDRYASLRYVARARLSALPPDGLDLTGGFPEVAEAADVEVVPSDDDRSLHGARDGLDVELAAVPQTSQGNLLVTVAGPCVDIPGDEQEYWASRDLTDDDLKQE